MTKLTAMRSAVCAAAILSAGSAMADVTAAQVWEDIQSSMTAYGEDAVTFQAETMQGDTLTISDLVITAVDEATVITMTMGDMVFIENGDGTVAVEMAPSIPMDINTAEGGKGTLFLTQSGMDLQVSGTPEQLIYTISADQYGVTSDEFEIDGADEPVDIDVRFIANDVAGAYTITTDTLRHTDHDVSVGSVDILVDFIPSTTPGDYFTFSGKIEDLSTKGSSSMPLDEAAADPTMIFINGMSVDGEFSYASGNYLFDVKADGEQSSGTAQTGAGTLGGEFSATNFSYNSAVQDIKLAISGGGIPFPIEVSMAEYGIGVDMPLGKTEEPADFGLRLNLTDLAVNDMIWMLADPTGALPHDPATLLLDLSGKAKLFFDLLDPSQEEDIAMADVPGELNAVTLNNLALNLGGAELTGLGDFTFDNSDLDTFDGMPRPEGDLTVNLKGGNALIDSLVKMGVIPEDQAMMGRMMMGMFARSTGDDELTSKIEINGQGHVIANGQRIQ